MHSRCLSLLVVLAALHPGAVRAATWYVNQDTGNDVNAGTLARPFETIGRAVLAAHSGDTVLVPNGTYTGYDNRNVDFGGKDISLASTGGAQNCIIDCERFGRALVFEGSETAAATVDGFTIRNGTPPDQLSAAGGAVFINNASPTFRNCTFSANGPWSGKYETTSSGAGSGGAFAINNSQSVFTNCTFQQNSAPEGTDVNQGDGGAVNVTDSHVSFTGCLFDSNTVTASGIVVTGGGLSVSGGGIALTGCRFTNNVSSSGAGGFGGGVFLSQTQADVTDSVFDNDNASGPGGGVCAFQGALITAANCTFSGNTATNSGGGVAISDESNGNLTRCLFSGNRVQGGEANGGGLDVVGSSATVTRSVFTGNVAENVAALSTGGGGGAAVVAGGSLGLTDCLLASNSAQSNLSVGDFCSAYGGGAECQQATLALTHCTLTLNTASSNVPSQYSRVAGGGCYNDDGTTTILNSVAYGNSARDAGANVGGYVSSTNTGVTATYSDIGGGYAGTGNINADPQFVSASDFHLQNTSPARDTASAFPDIPPTDLDGLPRIMGPAPDMGAYEIVSAALFVDKATGLDTNPGTPAAPFKTVTKALTVAPDHTTVAVRAGNYGTDHPSMTRPVRVLNWGGIGAARIGAQ